MLNSRLCKVCQVVLPIHAYHCIYCNKCIQEIEIHDFLLNKCITKSKL